jgi:2-desacetyl-2-hydroxyethyl bacteriochlorophyllide A dehydrogenase
MTTMRAAVVTGPQQLEVREVEKPEPQPGGVLVRVRNCGICGSDLHVYRNEIPAVGLRLGHEASGEVATVGESVAGLSLGQRVVVEPVEACGECEYCRTGRRQLCPGGRLIGMAVPGAFAEYLHVSDDIVHPLPDELDFEVGALVEPLAVSVHGLRLVGLAAGERVAVIGSGTIGLTALVAARAMGASDVFATARYPHQAEAARALGADLVVEANESVVEELQAAFGGRPPEVVVETVGGRGETLNQAIAIAKPGGRVSILGVFTGPVSINATLAVLKEVLMLGAYTYGSPGSRSDFEVAIEIAAKQPEELRRLITHRVSLDNIQEGFAAAADKSQRSIKVTVEV